MLVTPTIQEGERATSSREMLLGKMHMAQPLLDEDIGVNLFCLRDGGTSSS